MRSPVISDRQVVPTVVEDFASADLCASGPHPEQQESADAAQTGNNNKLNSTDTLTPLLAVVPGENNCHEKTEDQCQIYQSSNGIANAPSAAQHVHHLHNKPGASQIAQRPLDQLALLQTFPKVHIDRLVADSRLRHSLFIRERLE